MAVIDATRVVAVRVEIKDPSFADMLLDPIPLRERLICTLDDGSDVAVPQKDLLRLAARFFNRYQGCRDAYNHARGLPAHSRRQGMTEDTAWLIEHTHDPRFGRESWYSGKDGFTIDSLQAVRFARKEDAEREIDRFPTTLAKNLIAAHHAWIPARVCPHGQLARRCEICEAQQAVAHWRAKAENAFEPIRKIADALAQGGFHCHDKPGFVVDHLPGIVCEAVTELKIKRIDIAQLRTDLNGEKRRRTAMLEDERRLGSQLDEAKVEAADLRARLSHLRDTWRLIGDSLREFGHEPTGEDQWVALVHRALVELDQRRHQRTSCQNLLVEILATPDDTTEDSEWLILHARLEKFLFATGERGLKNILGTVTMLRDRLLDIGNEVLSKQVHEPRDGCLKLIDPNERVDCR